MHDTEQKAESSLDHPISPELRLSVEVDVALAKLEVADRQRSAAWETSPGNVSPAHILMNAQGYHRRFHDWVAAARAAAALNSQLSALLAAQATE